MDRLLHFLSLGEDKNGEQKKKAEKFISKELAENECFQFYFCLFICSNNERLLYFDEKYLYVLIFTFRVKIKDFHVIEPIAKLKQFNEI